MNSAIARVPSPLPLRNCLVLLAAVLQASAAAQSDPPQQAQPADPWPAVFAERTEVNVVNVDVFVTDAEGRPVTGLGPEDFRLISDGEPVEISNFFAVERGELLPLGIAGGEEAAEETAADTPRPLNLVIFVDDANITAANRKRVFDRLREFLLASWRPGLRAMVARQDLGLEISLPFTQTPHDVFVALDELQRAAPVGQRFDLERTNILRSIESVNVEAGNPSLGVKGADLDLSPELMADQASQEAVAVLPQIRLYAQQRFDQVQRTLRTLRSFVDTAAGLDGRKAVLYLGDGLPLRPGEALYEAYARRFASLASGQGISPETEAARDDASADFERLAAHANASGVTFYTLYAAPPAALSRGSAATTGSSGGNFGGHDLSVEGTEERNSQESMVLMAEGTGGRHGLSNASLDAVLEGVITDHDNHYSLGFEADRLPPGERRRIRVEAKDPSLRLRYRSSFLEKSVEEKVAARTLSALLLDVAENPLGITLKVEPEKEEKGGEYVVPLRVQVPLGKLVLLPGTSAHQAQISMYVAARDEKGRTSEVVKHLCPIRIPNAEVLTALGRTAVCGLQLRMRGGDQRVAVSVRDELAAQESTASISLQVPGGEAPDAAGAAG